MKTPLSVFLVLMLAGVIGYDRYEARFMPGVPPLPVDPHDITASLVPEKTAILPGEPIFVTFTLHNKGARNLGVNLGAHSYFNAPGSAKDYFQFTVTDAQGHVVPILPDRSIGFVTTAELDDQCRLPAGTEYTVPLLLSERVALDTPGDYTITVVKKAVFGVSIPPTSYNSYNYAWGAQSTDLQATATLRVLPPDPVAMGRLIDSLGGTLVAYSQIVTDDEMQRHEYEDLNTGGSKPGQDYSSLTRFAAIHGPRTAPWLLKLALTSPNQAFRRGALMALGADDDGPSLDALKTAMDTLSGEIPPSGYEAVFHPASSQAVPPAVAFREQVMSAISRNKNPGALAYALTLRHDPDPSVRMCVEYMAIRRMASADAIPIVHEFTADSNPEVARSAKYEIIGLAIKADPRAAIPMLTPLVEDPDKKLSASAKDALEAAQNKLKSAAVGQR